VTPGATQVKTRPSYLPSCCTEFVRVKHTGLFRSNTSILYIYLFIYLLQLDCYPVVILHVNKT